MKPREQRHTSFGPCVSLYREDFDAILQIIGETCQTTEITDTDFVYDSLDDVEKQRGPKLKEVFISGTNPTLSVNLRREAPGVKIVAEGGSSATAGFLRITDLLSKRKSFAHYAFHPYSLLPLFGAVFIGILLIRRDLLSHSRYILLLTLVFILLLLVVILTAVGVFSSFRLVKKHLTQTFWSRNKDNIILSIVSAIIGSGITLLISYLV